MEFFMNMIPPTCTAQMKKVAVVHGHPVFYDTPTIKEAKALLCTHLLNHRPREPLKGAISLKVIWRFPPGKSHKNGEWRTTKPDTDNLEKLLKDCMTKCGYWNDDAQVVRETCEKLWSNEPSGIYIELNEMEVMSDV